MSELDELKMKLDLLRMRIEQLELWQQRATAKLTSEDEEDE